jgi:CSLREA domain-containing protein
VKWFVLAALLIGTQPTAAAGAFLAPEGELRVTTGVAPVARAQGPPGRTGNTVNAPQTLLTVDTAADLDNGSCNPGACTLRDAIAAAAAGDTIIFAGDYSIYLNSTLTINKELTVDGSGRAITISGDTGNAGAPNVQVLAVTAGAVATLTHLSLVSGTTAFGGGIYNAGTLMLAGCTLSGNAAYSGGGIYNAGLLTITGCTLSANRADEEGGGIYNGGILALIDSTLSGNGATYRGGGIYNTGNLTVTGSMLSNHGVGRRGGAIYNIGTLDVNGSAFSDNWANIDGGAIYNEGAATVTGSTLSGNEVDARGGGIFSSGVLTVTGSTLSGNETKLRGGGIYNWGTLTLTGSTLFGNSATAEGGGLYNESSCTLHYAYTIIAHSSSGGDCYNDGAIDLNSHNLVQDGSCAAAFSGDPLLAPLDDNGGATFTHALLPGSPAIDAIPLTACPLAADQRGASRNDWACDIGAFEVQFDDSDTASRTILSGNTYTFGPTLVQIQVNGDGGCLTGLTIQRIETHHPNATDGIKTGRYWDITPIPADCTGGLSLTVTLPLSVSH